MSSCSSSWLPWDLEGVGTNVKEVQVRTQGNTGAPRPVGSTPLSAPLSASQRDAGGILVPKLPQGKVIQSCRLRRLNWGPRLPRGGGMGTWQSLPIAGIPLPNLDLK